MVTFAPQASTPSPSAIRLGMALRQAELYATALPFGTDRFRLDWQQVASAWSRDLLRSAPIMPSKAFLIPEELSWDEIEERVWVLPPKGWQLRPANSPVANAVKWLAEEAMLTGGDASRIAELRITTRDGYYIANVPAEDHDGLYNQLLRHLELL